MHAAHIVDKKATNIIVFGRGLAADEAGAIRLSRPSIVRVNALVSYVEENRAIFSSRRGRIVFSGGWAWAAEGMKSPPASSREAALMLKAARALGIAGKDLSLYADSYSEIESDSTLENVLLTKERGYFGDTIFTAGNPLGIVAHDDHLKRIEYLVRKVFAIPGEAILHISAAGNDPGGRLSESMILFLTRLAFLGAHSHVSLRRRHRMMVMIHNLAPARLLSN
jgi:DUF218 domain